MNAPKDFFPALNDQGVLRLITAGSVDDGKSTLIGRLLYDSKGVFADQLEAIARARHKRVEGDRIDFALLTDGLEAEREQGITIDVAYRYFATPRRKFIVADAPGHEQYTRNMVTGASTADAAIILIDASRNADGTLLAQTKRHSTIAKLLGIRHIIVAVNKMDLVNWDPAVFNRIRDAYTRLAEKLEIQHFHILPISALEGDNVVHRSAHSPWYEGQALLPLLESLDIQNLAHDAPLRLPVQWVIRHGGDSIDDFRGYAGRISSGRLQVGDELAVQASGVRATVTRLLRSSHECHQAIAGDSIVVVLDKDVDISRGDLLSLATVPAKVEKQLEAEICWLDGRALNPARKYLLKHGARLTSAKIRSVHTQRNIHELQEETNTRNTLEMNEIGRVSISTRESLAHDAYADLPATGAFILIDEATHQTAAAGMIR